MGPPVARQRGTLPPFPISRPPHPGPVPMNLLSRPPPLRGPRTADRGQRTRERGQRPTAAALTPLKSVPDPRTGIRPTSGNKQAFLKPRRRDPRSPTSALGPVPGHLPQPPYHGSYSLSQFRDSGHRPRQHGQRSKALAAVLIATKITIPGPWPGANLPAGARILFGNFRDGPECDADWSTFQRLLMDYTLSRNSVPFLRHSTKV